LGRSAQPKTNLGLPTGLQGDLSADPLAQALKDRLTAGGLGINVTDVVARQKKYSVPK